MNSNLLVKSEPVAKLAFKPHLRMILLVTDGSAQIHPGINNAIRMAQASSCCLAIAYFSGEPQKTSDMQKIVAQIAQRAREAGLNEVKTFANSCPNEEAIDCLSKMLEADLVVLAM